MVIIINKKYTPASPLELLKKFTLNIDEKVIYMPRVPSFAVAQRTILATINVRTLGVDFSLKNEYYHHIAGRRAMSVSVERVGL